MQGFQITFFTQQNRQHNGKPIAEWLLQVATELQLSGMTVMSATAGIGHHHQLHAAHFFELADQPLLISTVLSANDLERLWQRLQAENLTLFYTKTPVEFGVLGYPGV